MASFVERLWGWVVDRANLRNLPLWRVPPTYFNLDHWLGAIVASAFAWLAMTGLLLLIWYNPSKAYDSTVRLVNEIPYGRLLLSSHLYAAHAMILSAYVHMFRNFFKAAYKKPRELLWIVGVLSGVMTLNTAFLGYVLVGDITASDAINVGKGVVTGVFGTDLGNYILSLLFGTSAEETYNRVLAFHVTSAALLATLFLLHLALFEAYGPPADPRESRWKASLSIVSQARRDLAPWYPSNLLYILYMTGISWGLILSLLGLALASGEAHPLISPLPGPPAGAETEHPPYPPWFFLFFYKIADFVFLSIQEPIAVSLGPLSITIPASPVLGPFVVGILLPLLYLIIVPFLDRSDERHPLKRPVHTAIGAMIVVYLVQATIWGALTPGEPIHVETAAAVMLPPMITVALGVYMLSKRHIGILVRRSVELRGLAAVYTGILGLIASGAVVAIKAWESFMAGGHTGSLGSAFLGALGSAAGLAIISALPRTGDRDPGDPSQAQEVLEKPGEFEAPGWMLLLAGFYTVMLAASGISIALMDPLKSAHAIASGLSIVMLSFSGLSHMAFRTTISTPWQGDLVELRPHIAVLAIMILSIPSLAVI